MGARIAELTDESGARFLEQPFADLAMLYARVDEQAASVARNVRVPCAPGCSACCRESVLVTSLEALFLMSRMQDTLPGTVVDAVVHRGVTLLVRHRERILALGHPPCPGAPPPPLAGIPVAAPGNPGDEALSLRLDCPLLDDAGHCIAYAAREMRGRLFGLGSLPSTGRYFGCTMAQQQLVGQRPRLIDADAVHGILRFLPLTQSEQVIPYFLWRYSSLLLSGAVVA